MAIPTFSDLYTSIQSDLRNKLGIVSVIGKVVINAFSLVQAAKLKLFYLRSALTYKNIFFDQCDDETLLRYGRILLKRDPFPATAGEYKIEVTGDIGAVIAAGTTFKSRNESTSPGQLFVTDTLFTFIATTGIIDIRALEIGIVSELIIGDEVKSTQPLADIESIATVTSVESEPIEGETTDEYRAKVIVAAQVEPQGGARVDFLLWSLDAQGVRRVYPYVKDGEPSYITLYIEANPADSTDGNGTPSATIIQNTEDVIELDPDTTLDMEDRGRRPMWAIVEYFPIVTKPIDVEITNLSDVSLLPAIKAALLVFLFDVRPFLDGADNPNNSQQGKLYAADVVNVIRDTIGTAIFDDVEMQVDSVVVTSFHEFMDGDIPYIDNVTAV